MKTRPLAAELSPGASWAFQRELGTADAPSPLAKHAEQYEKKLTEWPSVTREIFGGLYDPDGSRPLPAGKRHALADQLAGALQALPQWPELQCAAQASRSLASATTCDVGQAVAQALGLPNLPDDKGDPEDLQAQRSFLEALPESPETREALEALSRDQALAQARRDTLEKALQGAAKTGKLSQAVAAAAETAKERGEAVRVLRGCGLGAGQTPAGTDPVNAGLCDRLRSNPLLTELLKLVGRMTRAADQAAPANGVGNVLPAGLKLGRELTSLLLTEWALDLEAPEVFMRRLLDGETVQTEREGPEDKNKGDLIVMVDRSGSMEGARHTWANALATASALCVVKDKRKALFASYSGTGDYACADLATPADLQGVLDVVGKRAGGNTDTRGALLYAAGRATKLRDPDILLITDGDWPALSKEDLALIKGKETRLYVVLIGANQPVPGADRVWAINNLNLSSAVDVLKTVTL